MSMAGPKFKNKSVDAGRFAMIPRADIPRSRFDAQFGLKTTFDSGLLVPIYLDEVLPGDTHRVNMTAFVRMATPIHPVMDNLHMDSFFFFVPNRLVWDNWTRFMGEQRNPTDSTDYLIPTLDLGELPVGQNGFPINSLGDYFGLPTINDITNATWANSSINALPFRAYSLIWNEWFRDQNLQGSRAVPTGDGPDPVGDYQLLRRGKRHDYFTSALPWPQKGDAVTLSLGDRAPVATDGLFNDYLGIYSTDNEQWRRMDVNSAPNQVTLGASTSVPEASRMYADLAEVTSVTINTLRQAFQIQKLLERNARGGTRYTELVKSHFGVTSPDARLQRPEYLGGGSTPVNINPVVNTQVSGDEPLGTLAGVATAIATHGFNYSATEHGFIIGLVAVRADLTYQQGMHKMWNRRTKFDHYWPAFAALGEQVVRRKEIYCNGAQENDEAVFGYQERWAEYRYKPSRITGRFRSTAPGTLDPWHLAQRFTTPPVLSSEFIEDRPPVQRVVAVGEEALGSEFLFDSVFNCRMVRPMPMYGVPGLIDHF